MLETASVNRTARDKINY